MGTELRIARPTLRFGAPDTVGMDPRRIDHIRELGRGWVTDGITPALVLFVARHGVIVLQEAFGRLENGDPVAPSTIFPLASLTKPITATALLLLVEEGRVGLGRAVQDYVSEFAGKGKDDVLVWHLLTHTSGLREMDVEFYASTQGAAVQVPPAGPTEHPLAKERLHRRYGVPLWKQPGEEMSYCDLNYHLLGEIVRRVSGMSLDGFIEQRIFRLLGLTDSFASFPACKSDRVATVPSEAFGAVAFERARRMPVSGAGGCWSSARDLAVLGQTFLNGGRYDEARLLSPATVAQMTRNQIPGIATTFFGEHHQEAAWGFGWQVACHEKWRNWGGYLCPPGTYSHAGATGVNLWIDPLNEIVGVYLSVATGFEHGFLRHRFDLFESAVYGALEE